METTQISVDLNNAKPLPSEAQLLLAAQIAKSYSSAAAHAVAPFLLLHFPAQGSPCLKFRFTLDNLLPEAPLASGISAFAMGMGGLELARASLRAAGYADSSLDQADAGRVNLDVLNLGFTIATPSVKEAAALAAELKSYARLRGLRVSESLAKRSTTYSIETHTEPMEIAGRDDLDGVTVILIAHPNKRYLTLEVSVDRTYLQRRGLEQLGTWKTAHDEDVYKKFFSNTVRRMFCLDYFTGHREPNDLDNARLGKELAGILADYVANKSDLESPRWPPGLSDAKKKSSLKVIAADIKRETGFDIMVPWKDFMVSPPKTLANYLRYGGDLNATSLLALDSLEPIRAMRKIRVRANDEEKVKSYFARENWPRQLRALSSEISQKLVTAQEAALP